MVPQNAMRKILTAVVLAAIVGTTALATSSPAEAWWRGAPPHCYRVEQGPDEGEAWCPGTRKHISDMPSHEPAEVPSPYVGRQKSKSASNSA
jgi:hypothetical protein